MKAQDFCYWLQGHFELGGTTLTAEQVAIVKEHLSLVFKHDPACAHPAPKVAPVPDIQPLRDDNAIRREFERPQRESLRPGEPRQPRDGTLYC